MNGYFKILLTDYDKYVSRKNKMIIMAPEHFAFAFKDEDLDDPALKNFLYDYEYEFIPITTKPRYYW